MVGMHKMNADDAEVPKQNRGNVRLVHEFIVSCTVPPDRCKQFNGNCHRCPSVLRLKKCKVAGIFVELSRMQKICLLEAVNTPATCALQFSQEL